MKKTFTLCLLFIFSRTFSQEIIDVTDQTIKIGGFKEEELMFGFAAGDKIIFSFQEINNKELKEVEVLEFPGNSKFSQFKSARAEKSFSIIKQGVYIFRFKNSALGGRVCQIKVQRVPASAATVNFNTAVNWVVKQDTTWNSFTKDVIVGYDSVYVQRTRKELVRVDTSFNILFDKALRVHSATALNGQTQYTYATINLPENSYYPNRFDPYKTTEVVAWSYWLGVGQKSEEEYKKANNNLATGIKVLGSLTPYSALASLVATGVSLFGTPTVGENVQYKFYGILNGQEIVIDYGNVISASARNDRVTQGSFNLQLYNDNFREGIDVNVKMIVMQITKTWQDRTSTELKVTPKTEKQLFKEPIITTSKIAVAGL